MCIIFHLTYTILKDVAALRKITPSFSLITITWHSPFLTNKTKIKRFVDISIFAFLLCHIYRPFVVLAQHACRISSTQCRNSALSLSYLHTAFTLPTACRICCIKSSTYHTSNRIEPTNTAAMDDAYFSQQLYASPLQANGRKFQIFELRKSLQSSCEARNQICPTYVCWWIVAPRRCHRRNCRSYSFRLRRRWCLVHEKEYSVIWVFSSRRVCNLTALTETIHSE